MDTHRRNFLGAAAACAVAWTNAARGAAPQRTLRLGVIGVGWYGMVDAKAANQALTLSYRPGARAPTAAMLSRIARCSRRATASRSCARTGASWSMLVPSIFTARVSGRSRAPD